ncbi:hypothetical protein [Streptomyces sp. NPDC046860]|uniref:hypothetical protein n=1 Tax=Streptomyces sp. NPDC046860 TaxID=3154495 RepID=UPI0033ED46A8
MSAATMHTVPPRPSGASPVAGGVRHHVLGESLRAIKVYAQAAFGVVILGEYGEEAGVHRRYGDALRDP